MAGDNGDLLVSVVMPVFNQVDVVGDNIRAIVGSMSVSYEIILIDDCSSDGTTAILRDIAAEVRGPRRIRLLRTPKPFFETLCDSVGFALAGGRYFLEVQADMLVDDPGCDERMISALDDHDDLLMVSGRGVEPLAPVAAAYVSTMGSVISRGRNPIVELLMLLLSLSRRKSNAIGESADDGEDRQGIPLPNLSTFEETGFAGRVGMRIVEDFSARDLGRGLVWVGDTVMRGPLMIHADRLRTVGGLDHEGFFLGFDDHDLAYRAYRDHGLRCGFLPIGFSSPVAQGSTRHRRTVIQEIDIFRRHMVTKRRQPGTGLYEAASSGVVSHPPRSIRPFGGGCTASGLES